MWLTRNLDDDSVRVLDLIENEDSSDPEKLVEIVVGSRSQIHRCALERKLVITLYYYEGLIFKEIGQTLNISESRVRHSKHSSFTRKASSLARQLSL